jgi:dynein heavy chain
MSALKAFLEQTKEKLAKPPQTLDEMCDTIELLDNTTANLPTTSEKFGPINDQFDILYKHAVEIGDEDAAMLDALPTTWADFQAFLDHTSELLEDSRREFKASLLKDTEALTRRVEALRAEFLQNGPYSGDITPAEALESLVAYRVNVQELKDTDGESWWWLQVL